MVVVKSPCFSQCSGIPRFRPQNTPPSAEPPGREVDDVDDQNTPLERFSTLYSEPVAGVSDVIATFGGREQRECGRDERRDVIESTGSCGAEQRFQCGKRLLDGIEIGTIRRQKAERGADRGDRRLDFRLAVHRQIVEDDHVPWPQGGDEHLLDVRQKAAGVERAIKHRGRREASGRRAATTVWASQCPEGA